MARTTSERSERVERVFPPAGGRVPPAPLELAISPLIAKVDRRSFIEPFEAIGKTMAKKGSKGRKFNLRRVTINSGAGLGALAASDVMSAAISSTSANQYRVTSVKASYVITEKAGNDDGQAFGLAHSDYSAAEIEECLEAVGAIDQGDKVAQEQVNRLVRQIGTMVSRDNTEATFNDGRPVKTKLNWLIGIGDTLVVWVRNSSGVIYTTGASIRVNGEMWITP